MLAVFAEFERGILRERVKAGIAEARRRGTRHGRPPTVADQGEAVRQLAADGLSKSAIARDLVDRTHLSTTLVRPGMISQERCGAGVGGQRNAYRHFPAITPKSPKWCAFSV